MPFEFPIGVARNNPLVNSVFTQGNSEGGAFPPPGSLAILTENGLSLTTENNIDLITEG